MKQDDVAASLGLPRTAIVQIESGNRAVSSLELDKLAYLYGRDIRDLLADEPHNEELMVALFRRHPDISGDADVLAALRQCLSIGRAMTHLERLLGVDRDISGVVKYVFPAPSTRWDAIQQGDRVAKNERQRLGLGSAPAPEITELLETQGVRTAQVRLPDHISGLTLVEAKVGVFLVANREHHVLRRRFSFAHEYCHVLLDRERQGTISGSANREDLLEVRANSFAASFLMPEDGVRDYVHGLAKGRPSRSHAQIYDEGEPVRAESRTAPGTQAIQLYDVAQLAYHFGVSRLSALFRLRNLRLVSQPDLEHLREEDERVGRDVAGLLGLPEPNHHAARNEFRHRYLSLGLEALRRGEITTAKFCELAAMIEVPREDIDRMLRDTGLDEIEDPVDALLPEER